MVVWALLLAASVTARVDAKNDAKPLRPDPNETAAEVITLRDGTTLLGQLQAIPQPAKGSGKGTGSKGVQPITIVVRRAWAEAHQKDRLALWDKASEPEAKQAIRQQRERLAGWRRERSAEIPEDQKTTDRVLTWIDRRIGQLDAPGNASRSTLLVAKIPRGEIKGMTRKPAALTRLLASAWLCDLPDPETMSADQLKEGIEGRGLVAETSRPVSIDTLLPPGVEPEARWLARRAATEVMVDPGLRFIRYQDLVFPDSKDIQGLEQIGLNSGLSELKNLLNPDENRPDPLVERFRRIEASGKIGALVTRLNVPADFSSAGVEVTLWVRVGPKKWIPAGSQAASVRPEDVAPEAGNAIAEDPQIKSAFHFAELLGLGGITQDLKDRSLRIGAATQKALGLARSASETDLNALAFPIFKPEPAKDEAPPLRPENTPENGKPGK